MQNPEVWSFQEPQSRFEVQEINTSNSDIWINHYEKFYFSHLVSVVIPESLKVPDHLVSILSDDCEYYKIFNLNLSDLINFDFINNFIKKGKLSLLSIGTRIDCDNCVTLLPTGVLLLSLTKDTYQTFGLEGKISHFTKRNKDRYIVTIYLGDAKLLPEKSYYKKTKNALRSLGNFSIILTWEPPDESVCPSSVAKFFDTIKYNVKLCEPTFKSHVVYSIKTPTLQGLYITKENIIDFVEWLGIVSIDGDTQTNVDNYVNSYLTPEPNVELGQIRVLTWRGFYDPSRIMKLINYIKDKSSNEDIMWSSIYIQGFSDALVRDRIDEQNYFTDGSNANICIIKKRKSWICEQRCSTKRYK